MAVIILPHRATGVRPRFYGINRDSPQATGLVAWYPLAQKPPALEVIGGSHLSTVVGTAPTMANYPTLGTTAKFASGGRQGTCLRVPVGTKPSWALSCWLFNTTTNPSFPLSYGPAASGTPHMRCAGGTFYHAVWGSGDSVADAGVNPQNTWTHVLGEFNGTSSPMWISGVLKATATPAGSFTVSGTTVNVGHSPAGAADYVAGGLADCRIYKRALTAAEVWALYAPESRWDLYWQPSSRVYFDIPARKLLDVSRIESGRVTLSPQALDLREVAEDVIGDILRRSQEENKPMALSLDAPKRLPRVYGDIERIRQVLGNLMDNAYHYTPENGTIIVQIHALNGGHEVQVDVKDNGVGIAVEDQDRIFERFYRGENPLVLSTPGTGLGLSIVKQIVEMHKGHIWM